MRKQWNLWFHNSLRVPAALALVWVLFAAPRASAEWYKDYESAVSSVKKNQYADAIPRLEAALREKPQEGAGIKFYGMNFGDYFPHYYLGKCYFYLQNYKAALAEFDLSEQQGQIQKKRDLWNQLSQLRTMAKAQLVVTSPPKMADSIEPLATQPRENVRPKTEQEQPKAQDAEMIQVNQTSNPSQEPSTATAKKVEETTNVVPEISRVEPEKNSEELAQEKAKELIQSGARKYFQGDYDRAVALLTGALEARPDEVNAQFLLGCSYAAKYLLSGSQDQSSLQKASANFQKVKRTSPNYLSSRNPYISPAILDIYEKAGV